LALCLPEAGYHLCSHCLPVFLLVCLSSCAGLLVGYLQNRWICAVLKIAPCFGWWHSNVNGFTCSSGSLLVVSEVVVVVLVSLFPLVSDCLSYSGPTIPLVCVCCVHVVLLGPCCA